MNIQQALQWSKDNGGRHISRARPQTHGTVGWIASFKPEFVYRLTFEDLTADDWEPAADTIARVTNGRWAPIE
jgi:hypothetical protein